MSKMYFLVSPSRIYLFPVEQERLSHSSDVESKS